MKRNGFTLIELLVVISIIMLLVGIMVPVIRHVKMTTRRNASKATLGLIDGGIGRFKADFTYIPCSREFLDQPTNSTKLYRQLTGWKMGATVFNPDYEEWGFRTARAGKRHGPYIDAPDKMAILCDDQDAPVEVNGERFFADSWNNPVFYGRAATILGELTFENSSAGATKDLNGQAISYLDKARESRSDFILATAGANQLWGFFGPTSASTKKWGDGEYDTTEQRYSDTFDDATNLEN
jgi:prepilin-type N-terminal cleavage/methylation domain-containing protein